MYTNPIIEFMSKRNLTRRELAEVCGVSLGTAAAWIRGDFGPSEKNLQNLQVLGLIPSVAVEKWAEWRKAKGDSTRQYLVKNGDSDERLPGI